MIIQVLLGLLCLWLSRLGFQFYQNIAKARSSGIAFRIVPVFAVNRLWMTLSPLVLPVLHKLPDSWTSSWLPLMQSEWAWKKQYEPFAEIGSDTFLTVSPTRIMLHTAEASVIHQITNRRTDFPKALEVYETLRVYGMNLIVTEGDAWRHHRRIVSPPFSEKNNMIVWRETLDQCRAMVDGWFGASRAVNKAAENEDPKICTEPKSDMAKDIMRLSLHIISKAGFGVDISWPGQEESASEKLLFARQGHSISYTEALSTVLDNIIPIIIFPRFLLKWLPLQSTKRIYQAYIEWGLYMSDMLDLKRTQIKAPISQTENMDLMLAMLRGSISDHSQPEDRLNRNSLKLSDDEILGNVFILILAGHETTAGSMIHSLLLLAMDIPAQRRLQKDIDATFAGRPVEQWDYTRDIATLFGNMAGAVMNEQLRLLPPVVSIPKCTERGRPQTLFVHGKKCTVPENTYISILTSVAHRNPHQWPTDSSLANIQDKFKDLQKFNPARWFNEDTSGSLHSTEQDSSTGEAVATEELNLNAAPDISPKLFKPAKGAYLPFSEGYRSCIGRRFAQVEILAMLAFIFSQYSVELSVREWASDEELRKMDPLKKRGIWQNARSKAEKQIREDMFTILTLQLRKGFFGLRLVKRGHEFFDENVA